MSERRAPIVALVDELIAASRVETAARACGWRVEFARGPDEFRHLVQAQRPALVLVGLSATRQPWESLVAGLKQDPALSGVPVLAFGSHMDLDLRERALRAGCDRFVANSQVATSFPALLAQMGLPVEPGAPSLPSVAG